MKKLQPLIDTAAGRTPADLVLTNGRIIDVVSGRIKTCDLAIHGGIVAGIGKYDGRETIDLGGRYIAPGFIDSHIHIESSFLVPSQFARAAVPRGTTTVIADPHEIANVLGTNGIRFMYHDSLKAPLDVFFTAPSCVPATHLETAGAVLTTEDIAELLKEEWIVGLGEMMNFPGVIYGDEAVLSKLEAARNARKVIDGHAPGVSGKELCAYLSAGITSDHECTLLSEAREKLDLGMFIMIREGSQAKNMDELLPLVSKDSWPSLAFVSDDIHADDLLDRGYFDFFLRKAIDHGVDPVTAVRMVTLSPSARFGLVDRGALVPGRKADIVVLDDVTEFSIHMVIKEGTVVSKNGQVTFTVDPLDPSAIQNSINLKRPTEDDLKVPWRDGNARVIQLVRDQIITDMIEEAPARSGDWAVSDTQRDIIKIAVFERHRGTGNIGIGFVHGFGLKAGAIASTVAHDSHNLVVIGTRDGDMLAAVHHVMEIGGGQAVVKDGEVISSMALPVAGLMSEQCVEDVAESAAKNIDAVKKLGCMVKNPFMTLSFLSLPVIPKLKLTDRGLVDVELFDIVPLYRDSE
ncbi:MAG: adenine deaminase [Deltaproteobacteria bacterium]|nr:adenine deaminase [Candidatus Zymogenaceae bacterium]